MEIYDGIINDRNPNSSALCFIREIPNLEQHLTDSNVARFIDLKSKTDESDEKEIMVDQEAKSLLDDLKYQKLPAILNERNIFEFQV